MSGPGLSLPGTPAALWCWLRGEDRGSSCSVGRHLQAMLEPSYRLHQIQDAFVYAGGRDSSGYEHSYAAFEAISRRMLGGEDGIQDSLFQYSRLLSLSYFWCPPVQAGLLDSSALTL